MAANCRNGGCVVGVVTSDVRNSPALSEAHHPGPVLAMHSVGLGPSEPLILRGDRCLHCYAVGSDSPGVRAAFYIDYSEGWNFRHVVFGSFSQMALHVWCPKDGCQQCELARSLGKAQAKYYRQRLSCEEVCR